MSNHNFLFKIIFYILFKIYIPEKICSLGVHSQWPKQFVGGEGFPAGNVYNVGVRDS